MLCVGPTPGPIKGRVISGRGEAEFLPRFVPLFAAAGTIDGRIGASLEG